MEEAVETKFKIVKHKDGKTKHFWEDRISQLPDEILVVIISFLTMNEAARTSILSRRWINLWTYFTGSLNFENPKIEWECPTFRRAQRPSFVKWVNKIMDSHQGLTIEGFRVCFDLDKSSKSDIDNWIGTALSKKVKNLELKFSFKADSVCYAFPVELFFFIQTPGGLSCIQCLTSLYLERVRVTGELLEYFLANCPYLKQLWVDGSSQLVELKVTGPSLRLQHLAVISCRLKKLKISAPNLISFNYQGDQMQLHIENAPLLAHVYIGGSTTSHIGYAFYPLSSCFSQLETLTLNMFMYLPQEDLVFPQCPELLKLRHLTWIVHASDEKSLIPFTSLIKAATFLESFTLQLTFSTYRHTRKLQLVDKCPHPHLKIVQIVGFVGRIIDVELVSYLLENAIMLEKAIISPRCPLLVGTPWEFDKLKEFRNAKKSAQQLIPKLPAGAELIIL